MTKTEKYIAVEVHAFGYGMQTLFQGVAEVFSAMGMKAPDTLEEQSSKWQPDENTEGGLDHHENAAEEPTADAPDAHDGGADVPAADEAPASMSGEKTGQETTAQTPQEEPAETPAGEKQKKSRKKKDDTPSSVTQDDITRIIVQKIKQNRNNNEKIGQLLKTYGAARVGDLPASKYEAFITDLAAI